MFRQSALIVVVLASAACTADEGGSPPSTPASSTVPARIPVSYGATIDEVVRVVDRQEPRILRAWATLEAGCFHPREECKHEKILDLGPLGGAIADLEWGLARLVVPEEVGGLVDTTLTAATTTTRALEKAHACVEAVEVGMSSDGGPPPGPIDCRMLLEGAEDSLSELAALLEGEWRYFR